MKKQLLAFSGALLLAAALIPFGFAQTKMTEQNVAPAPPPRQLLRVQYVRLKPGRDAAWREFFQQETLPMLRKAGVKQLSVYQPTQFGGDDRYMIIRAIENLAEYDGQTAARRVLGETGAEAYAAKRANFVESSHTVIIETRPELNIPVKPGSHPKLLVLTLNTVQEGFTAEYENFIKTKVLPLGKQTGHRGYRVSRNVYGGNLNVYRAATLFDSFEELAKYRAAMRKAQTAAKFSSKEAGVVSRENAIYRFLPELSLVPAPAATANQ
jgi:hypothetical protein